MEEIEDGLLGLYGALAKAESIVHDCVTFKGLEDYEFERKPLAIKIGPSLCEVQCHENRDANVAEALRRRYIKKTKPVRLFKQERAKIRRAVDSIIKTFFPVDEVKQFFYDHPLVEELRSDEMNLQRFERALDDLLESTGCLPDYKYMIKNEVLKIPKEGPKAPRMIINAGDQHQLAALLCISCFEKFWYNDQCTDHIKGADKHDAMLRIIGHLNDVGARRPSQAEGDGSSWDFTCSLKIRALIENPVLQHIADCLFSNECFNDVPKWCVSASLTHRTVERWTLNPSTLDWKEGRKAKLIIRSIRASGERGTSCLNHLINSVLWACCLLDEPELLFSSWSRHSGERKRYRISRLLYLPSERNSANHSIGYKGAFEGDDSAINTDDWVWETKMDAIVAFWDRAGFNMEIAVANKKFQDKFGCPGPASFTFTGYEVLVLRGMAMPIMMPEVKRNIASSSYTTSPYARDEGPHQILRVHEVGAQAMAARAAAYMPCLPHLSQYFHAQHTWHNDQLVALGKKALEEFVVDRNIHFKLGIRMGERVSVGDLFERSSARYNPQYKPFYSLLSYATTGYATSLDDEISLLQLIDLAPDEEHIARSVIPPLWR